ncbi:MAG TPA: nuclear transport factor 2 family protein [Chloroflexota bacterium]|nr:nuclear transport factor 2 family protein [Chloroflexota bacterium]
METDYTSLFGGAAQRQEGDALIETWRTTFAPLQATQHLLGPVEVRVHGGRATAECHVRAWHFLDGAPGGAEWIVAGHWVLELTERAGSWRIAKMTLQAFYQAGNTQLLQEASAG